MQTEKLEQLFIISESTLSIISRIMEKFSGFLILLEMLNLPFESKILFMCRSTYGTSKSNSKMGPSSLGI